MNSPRPTYNYHHNYNHPLSPSPTPGPNPRQWASPPPTPPRHIANPPSRSPSRSLYLTHPATPPLDMRIRVVTPPPERPIDINSPSKAGSPPSLSPPPHCTNMASTSSTSIVTFNGKTLILCAGMEPGIVWDPTDIESFDQFQFNWLAEGRAETYAARYPVRAVVICLRVSQFFLSYTDDGSFRCSSVD